MYKKRSLEKYLCQGDIVLDVKLEKIQDFTPKKYYKGILILTYTCDLIKNQQPVEYINYCPIFTIDCVIYDSFVYYKEKFKEKENPLVAIKDAIQQKIEALYDYKPKGLFYLMPDTIFQGEECYANLEQIFSINIDYLEEILQNRKVSLLSPWIEKLGFKLGYCFNRIALPEFPVKKFRKLYKKPHLHQIEELFNSI